MARIRVAVLMGGKSPEHRVSLVTGREVVRNLDKRKYKVIPVVVSRDGLVWEQRPIKEILAMKVDIVRGGDRKGRPKKFSSQGQIFQIDFGDEKPDIVFIAMHGPFGEDGTVQGMLELAGIPYTGAGVLASALGMDKVMFKKVMEKEKIPIPDYDVLSRNFGGFRLTRLRCGSKFRPGASIEASTFACSHCYKVVGKKVALKEILKKFKLPLVVKPTNQGSSVGVSIVHQQRELNPALREAFAFSREAIVEEYLPGTEVSCGVLGNDKPKALPVIEIVPKKEFFDYEAKYDGDLCEEIVPARISKRLTKKVQDLAVRVFQAIDCRGFGRVDMIISNNCRRELYKASVASQYNQPFVLEINTIPGLTPTSLLPQEAAAAGISYPQLLDRVIELALER